jgi:hypothetical protein
MSQMLTLNNKKDYRLKIYFLYFAIKKIKFLSYLEKLLPCI